MHGTADRGGHHEQIGAARARGFDQCSRVISERDLAVGAVELLLFRELLQQAPAVGERLLLQLPVGERRAGRRCRCLRHLEQCEAGVEAAREVGGDLHGPACPLGVVDPTDDELAGLLLRHRSPRFRRLRAHYRGAGRGGECTVAAICLRGTHVRRDAGLSGLTYGGDALWGRYGPRIRVTAECG